jgi:hypothetical protein
MSYFKSNFPALAPEFDPFELCFGRQPFISHLRPFGCKSFVLKCGNLDKFESRSSDGIFLGYTPHGRSYRGLNLETNTIVESCDVTSNETARCSRDVFKSASGKEMESIFVDEKLQGFKGDKDEHIAPPSTTSHCHTPVLKTTEPKPLYVCPRCLITYIATI